MTREEVAALIEQIPQGIHVDEFIVMLATKAAEYEREKCAQICEFLINNNGSHDQYDEGCWDCAEFIRDRSKESEED